MKYNRPPGQFGALGKIARRIVTALRVYIWRSGDAFGGVLPRLAKFNPPHIEDRSKDEAARKPR